MRKKSFSWGIIIVMFIIFFPIGIFMLVKKVKDEKFNYINNGRALLIIGGVLLGFIVLTCITNTNGIIVTSNGSIKISETDSMVMIVLGGAGLFSIIKGYDYMSKGKRYSRYVEIVNTSNDLRIASIAAVFPTTYNSAVADLRTMIDMGYFMNSYIDLQRGELVRMMPGSNVVLNGNNYNRSNNIKQLRTIKCPNCGATNMVVPGVLNECEYCGSKI